MNDGVGRLLDSNSWAQAKRGLLWNLIEPQDRPINLTQICANTSIQLPVIPHPRLISRCLVTLIAPGCPFLHPLPVAFLDHSPPWFRIVLVQYSVEHNIWRGVMEYRSYFMLTSEIYPCCSS